MITSTRMVLRLAAVTALGGSAWAQCELVELQGSDSKANDNFGATVATDGQTLAVVAADRDQGTIPGAGAAYVFDHDDGGTSDPSDDTWTEVAILVPSLVTPSDGAISIDVEGDWVVLGRVNADEPGIPPSPDVGAVSVFWRDRAGTPGDASDDTWDELDTLFATDALVGDRFGTTVDMVGDKILVTASNDDHGLLDDAGAAYVFRRKPNGPLPADDTWVQEDELAPNDLVDNSRFGRYAAFAGDFAAISSLAPQPRTYLFRFDDGGTPGLSFDDQWIDEGALPTSIGMLGGAVAMDDDELVVRGNDLSNNSYLHFFRRDDGGTPDENTDDVWIEYATTGDELDGGSLGLSGDIVAVGDAFFPTPVRTLRRDDNGTPGDLSDDDWIETEQVDASDGILPDDFGRVAVGGGVVVVGAPDHAHAPSAAMKGAVYVYPVDIDLCGDRESLSLSAGGTLALDFNAGLDRAHDAYWVFGSATGTSPGVLFPSGVLVPLNRDVYFNLTLYKPQANVFTTWIGGLSGEGKGTAALTVPPGTDPDLAGVTLHHAALFGETFTSVDAVTNAVALRLDP